MKDSTTTGEVVLRGVPNAEATMLWFLYGDQSKAFWTVASVIALNHSGFTNVPNLVIGVFIDGPKLGFMDQ